MRDHRSSRLRRWPVGVVVVGVLAAGCGGSSFRAAVPTTTTAPASAGPSTSGSTTSLGSASTSTTAATTGSGVTPILTTDAVTSTSCDDAPTDLADTRSERVASATAAGALEAVDLSSLVPRDAPAAGWQTEYLGGPPIGISSLPAGTVSEDRTRLVSNGVEDGFVRGFRTPVEQTRVFYAVYRFPTTSGAVNTADGVIARACERRHDFLSTKSGVIGARDGAPNGIIEMLAVRNRLLFDFYADGPRMDVDAINRLALDFFARSNDPRPGPTGADADARATASQACGRLFFMLSVPDVDRPTLGEFRSTARTALATIRNAPADPDARSVADALRILVASIASRPTTIVAADSANEKAAALDNACRQLTGRGVFRT
jgi:hypothetical protein